jgi:hypothetical protein
MIELLTHLFFGRRSLPQLGRRSPLQRGPKRTLRERMLSETECFLDHHMRGCEAIWPPCHDNAQHVNNQRLSTSAACFRPTVETALRMGRR